MNNELGRKITSLTLMTIMIAGGLTFAVPGVMPAAHAANPNLFVSAENSQFDNYMSGPQVIEVVVIDSDINDTDEAKGEPDVTVNGKDMRMVQAVDGNWYGYFADRRMAQIADSTSDPAEVMPTVGLNFGQFCSAASGVAVVGVSVSDSNGIAVPMTGDSGATEGSPSGATITATCAGDGVPTMTDTTDEMETYDGLNVVREPKDVNDPTGADVPPGQIGIEPDFWPFVQLYTLNPTGNVVVQYNKGGGVQTTTLTFDTVDQFAGAELDKAKYTPGSQVHATITDLWLNIDPTDEDSWTFVTTGTSDDDAATTNYQVFDENGSVVGDVDSNTDSNLLTGTLDNLMCEDNCRLLTTADAEGTGSPIISLRANDDAPIVQVDDVTDIGFPVVGGDDLLENPLDNPFNWETPGGFLENGVPVTITEQGPNSGVFGTYDESDNSVVVITSIAKRGTSAVIDYNETPATILVGLGFGSIDIMPVDDEWNSGEEIPIELVDSDANKNSRADEDLDLNNPDVDLIPALRTGDPLTLLDATDATLAGDDVFAPAQKFSARSVLTNTDPITVTDGSTLELTIGDFGDLFDAAPVNDADFHGFALFNYDVRSITDNLPEIESFDISVDVDGDGVVDADEVIADDTTKKQDLILLEDGFFDGASTGDDVVVVFTINDAVAPMIAADLPAGTEMPIVADFFGFGFLNDGLEDEERIASQIIRLELEETGDNTGIFEGSLEYTMINQLNILDPDTYEGLSTIADDPTFIVIEDLDDEESPRVNYFDRGADGVSTQIADQEEAPSHSGIVSFDLDTYKVADTVVITLEDLDLNVDTDLIDIYTTVDDLGSLTDVVGANVPDPSDPDVTNLILSNGDALGRLLDVTFDDQLWTTPVLGTSCSDDLLGITSDTGLAATGFTLIETERDSGKFVGDFQIPTAWCRAGASSSESTTGLDLEVNYVDFRDAAGETIEVGDSAGVRANTGSVSLDRTVYPVPFGVPSNFGDLSGETAPDNRSIFAIHASGINDDLTVPGSFLPNGDLTIHVRVNDPDFDVSASGEDVISESSTGDLPVGPVEISIIRGAETVIIGHAGGDEVRQGKIYVGTEIPASEAASGDTEIAIGELGEITDSDMTFMEDEDITITQAGATSPATGTFNDVTGDGEIDLADDMVDITNSDTGFIDGEEVTISQLGATDATADFTDLNGDENLEMDELTITDGGSGFVTGTITITGDDSDAVAIADFEDAIDPNTTIDDIIEITIDDPGFGFTDGPVTITGDTSDAVATVEFTDGLTEISDIIRDFGPMEEIAPDAGIFEADVVLRYTDGPSDSKCPATTDFSTRTPGVQDELSRFTTEAPSGENYCILQGDILQVEYTDPTDASGDVNTVTDSATFDLRNGVLQSDKSVYIIGSDMIMTLIEPDLDLNNDQAETWDLDLIEWDSDAATVTMGDADGEGAAFDPEPLDFRETGDSTGIFQIVIEIPEVLQGDRLERGEEIILEYTDWGPSGSDFVGDEDEDVNLTLYTSNFGATVELDQKVYSWTDKVYVTIVAPDHNFDGDLVDEIGNTDLDPIKISTRGFDLDNYKLVETGTDTGIFTGEVILTGFEHDADGDTTTGDGGVDTNPRTSGNGPTDGFLESDDDDGITVSFEFSEDETVVGSALIRWNIGEVQWLEASYPATGTGVVRIIDPDMNLDPEAVDNFDVDVWSDSDAGGIDLTVTETNEATGIFEGTVFFTVFDESSGHRLRVAEGDTVTAEYEDNTLPDPYTTADELDITATSLIGTVVPPLERAPIASCRVVDAFGNTLSNVSVDQQVQITCDLSNGQDREQAFAYLVQIQDNNGVTVSLAWITGSLSAGQSFSPALSWIPEQAGAYDATTFVWESVDNPTALSPPVSTPITVN